MLVNADKQHFLFDYQHYDIFAEPITIFYLEFKIIRPLEMPPSLIFWYVLCSLAD